MRKRGRCGGSKWSGDDRGWMRSRPGGEGAEPQRGGMIARQWDGDVMTRCGNVALGECRRIGKGEDESADSGGGDG